MSKKQIILIGGGGHCKSCIDVIESENEFEIAGIVDTADKIGNDILGYKVIGCDDDLRELKKKYDYAVVTIGQIKSANLRMKLFNTAKTIGFKFPVIIANSAYVSKHTKIKEGTIIMHQAFVNANVEIGINNIINTKALIEHDCTIGNHNHISTSTVINGNIKIGNNCFIGSNSATVQEIELKNNITIGVNSVITKNIFKPGIYFGNPLKAKNQDK